MNSLVIYDSQFGNTEKIAQRIAETLALFGTARAVRVTAVEPNAFDAIDLLVVGCPTQGWNSTPAMKNFIAHLDNAKLQRLFFAEFDTRFDKPRWLTGSAASQLDKQLRRLHVTQLAAPASFLVTATEGPLAVGELERAAEWAKELYDEFQVQSEPIVVPM
jgi:flavodoxin